MQNNLKIILVNYRYFISGGPERYMFNVKELLESHGAKVVPFSIKHNLNRPTEYDSYFLDPIGKGNEVYFSEYKINNLKSILQSFGRLFYSFEARKKLSKLIKEIKPDLVYVLYYQNKLSPSIFDAAKKHRVPVVVRISDFGNICAANHFYLSKKQEVCEKCLDKGQFHSVLNKCYHNSYIYSAFKYFSYVLHDIIKVSNKIDAFVIPSKFTKEKFIKFGIPKEKIFNIPTFSNVKTNSIISYDNFALFIGRIDRDKGIKTLVDAFINTEFNLKIIGFSSTNYDEQIKDYLKDKKHNITFHGKLTFDEIVPYLETCSFTIVPSECYDNFPNTILESFAFKKAVVASDLGSLKELVVHNETGLLFENKNSNQLKIMVSSLLNDKDKVKILGENGYQKLTSEFSIENHYESLINLFNSLVSKKPVL